MEYRAVRFALEAGYVWGQGMSSEKHQLFESEIVGLFLFFGQGWQIKPRDAISCPEVFKGKNRLYLHPMEVTGELEVGMIDKVTSLLKTGQTFKMTEAKVLDSLVDMSDEEYKAKLEGEKAAIRAALLVALKTKRKNLYASGPQAVEVVKECYHIKRLPYRCGRSSRDVEWQFTSDVLKELVAEGLVEAHPQRSYCYRTL